MNGPLDGIRIVDSTTVVAMPMAMHLMGDMGAEVIKVETHTQTRGEAGTFPDNQPGTDPWNREGGFHSLNRSKLGITLNLQSPDGVRIFKDLVAISDVVTENIRAGTMVRLGLGYEEMRRIKPDIIYISNTGFGQTGPWRRYAGIGRMFELTCGLAQFTGYQDEGPRRVARAFFDPHVGWTAVFAILAALHHRQETGEGQYIDLSMYQVGTSTLGGPLLDYISNGRNGGVMGNRHPSVAPHAVYPCSGDDKWIAIAIENDQQWDAFCDAMDSPPWIQQDKFADAFSRWRNQDELDANLGEWTKGYDHLELMDRLQRAGVPAGAVLNGKELLTNPHLKERNFYERVTFPPEAGAGTRIITGRAWKMSESSSFIRRPAPRLGEHNEFVMGEILAMDADEIEEMYENGVAGDEPLNQRPPGRPASLDAQVESGAMAGYDPDYKQILEVE